MSANWKTIPAANCGAAHVKRDLEYYVPGWFCAELMQMAYLLSSGEKIDPDTRRDMAQRIQTVMDVWSRSPATSHRDLKEGE